MTRKKSAAPRSPQVLDPIRGCVFCGGTGWVNDLTSPAMMRGSERVEYRPPVIRCRCTMPQTRAMEPAPEPEKLAGLDSAQRAAGEKED